jgi:Phenylalanyl-tRNA synthetase alpha subunit
MTDIKKIKDEYENKLDRDSNTERAKQTKTEPLGKNGKHPSAFKAGGPWPNNERKKFAPDPNPIKAEPQEKKDSKRQEIETKETNPKPEKEKVDATVPERELNQGKKHPEPQAIEETPPTLAERGPRAEEGPERENEHYNFTALNTPENHPARDMHDTFYLDNNKELLLRTHTSPVQVRTMLNGKPPFKIIAPGRTYRI